MATANVSQAGAILRKFRVERGMRQVDLAQAAGITQSIISELETGETEMSVYYARKMAQALGVPAAMLVREMGLLDGLADDEDTELAMLRTEYPTLVAMLARLRTLSQPAQERVIAAMRAWMDVESASQERVNEERRRLENKHADLSVS